MNSNNDDFEHKASNPELLGFQPMAQATPPGTLGSLSILIIEDQAADAQLLVRALRKHGFTGPLQLLPTADEATRYLEGLVPYRDRQKFPFPDLIILDLFLPGMSGLDFLRNIHTKVEFEAPPVVVLSGSPYLPQIKEAYALGAKTFFLKPIDDAELQQLVQYVMNHIPQPQVPPSPGLRAA